LISPKIYKHVLGFTGVKLEKRPVAPTDKLIDHWPMLRLMFL